MRILKLLRLFASIVLILLFAITASLTIVSRTVVDNLADISTYEAAIQQTQFTERGRGILANGLVVYGLFANQSTARYISGHSLETWDSVADVLIKDAWLEGNLILVIDSTITWLKDPEINYPNLEIDM